jgi:hypothetical protein
MNEVSIQVSDEIKKSVQKFLQSDPNAKRIAEIEEQIGNKRSEMVKLQADLFILQNNRLDINLEYRKSIMWCLEIDAHNKLYFLKNKESLVKCSEYKHKIKLTPKQNSSYGATLSIMFKEKLVGRVIHSGVYYYGLPKFFDKNEDGLFTELKDDYVKRLPHLKNVTK